MAEQKSTEVTTPIIVCACEPTDSYTADTEIVGKAPIQIPNRIRFCPVHAKAQEMYKMLVEAISELSDASAVSVDEFGDTYCCGTCGIYDDEPHTCFIGKCEALIAEIDEVKE